MIDELLNSMGWVSDPIIEDISKSGFVMEDPDIDDIHRDIPSIISDILDINNII